MRLEEIVGSRIRAIREGRMTQAELGQRLEPFLGHAWSRQAVFAAEKGEREFKVAELVAIAHALSTTVTQLITPGPEVREHVSFPGGKVISPMELVDAVLPPVTGLDTELDQALTTGNELADHIVETRAKVIEASEAGAKAMDALARMLRQVQTIARHPEPHTE